MLYIPTKKIIDKETRVQYFVPKDLPDSDYGTWRRHTILTVDFFGNTTWILANIRKDIKGELLSVSHYGDQIVVISDKDAVNYFLDDDNQEEDLWR